MTKKAIAPALLYAATIPLANWFIGHVGTQSFPGGPHTIPVGFGYQAPSGVLWIGVALVARDWIQMLAGKRAVLAAIAVGVALSYVVNPAVATASAVAFALGELADFGVYTPLAERGRIFAGVLLSGLVGAVIDSLVFLQIAFGSTMFWQGQVIGKTWISLLGAGVMVGVRRAVSDRLNPEVA